MKAQILFLLSCMVAVTGCSQNTSRPNNDKKEIKVGGGCEGCEAVYESPIPFEKLNWIDTLPDFNEEGPKLEVSGIIYKRDGKTPAAGVVLYIYHTDQKGIYAKKGNEEGWGKRHGYIRGWVRTNENGQYRFYTLVPASYPNSSNPKHIHPTIKEPGYSEYWIDEFVFDDDPLLPKEERTRTEPRGGGGVLKTYMKDGMLRATRNIILGLNVPGYPVSAIKKLPSGLAIGANCPAFDPLHLSGADKGKTVCPMCKYGYGQGVMVWLNDDGIEQMNEFVSTMETAMEQRGVKKLRVFLIYMNPAYKTIDKAGTETAQQKIREWCEKQNLQQVAMVWVPSPVDEETSKLYKINPDAKNTIFIYKKRKVDAKWVDIEFTNESAHEILKNISAS